MNRFGAGNSEKILLQPSRHPDAANYPKEFIMRSLSYSLIVFALFTS